jgi:hypothetical protein
MIVNNADIHNRVKTAMSGLIHKNGVAAPVDVLIELGVLSKEDYENWRFGHVPYLEKVCKINLSKLSTIMREMRAYAKEHNLKESWTAYQKWGKGGSVRLRFSKSGNENVERGYATHFVSLEKVKSQAPLLSDQ